MSLRPIKQAHSIGLFGPRIVWLFSQRGDIVSVENSECSKENLQEFDKGVFFYTIDNYDIDKTTLSIGMTGGEFNSMVYNRIANLTTNRLRGYVNTCFDTINGVALLLDALERRLKAIGTSMRLEVDEATRQTKLQDEIVSAIYDLDIDLYTGRVKYQPGRQRVIVGGGFFQSQGASLNDRVMVYYDNANTKDPNRFKYPLDILWKTPDGSKPYDQPVVREILATVELSVAIIYSIVAAGLISILCTFIFKVTFRRNQTNPLKLVTIRFLGLVLIQVVIISYPFTQRHMFCQLSPVLMVVGCFLILWSIVTTFQIRMEVKRNWTFHRSRINTARSPNPNGSRRLERQKQHNSQKQTGTSSDLRVRSQTDGSQLSFKFDYQVGKMRWSFFLFCSTIISLLFILWYTIAHPPIVRVIVESSYNYDMDTITLTKYEHCASPDGNEKTTFGFFGTLLGILTCFLFGLIGYSLSTQSDNHIFTKTSIRSSYCVVPSIIAVILLTAINLPMNIAYYVIVLILEFKTISLLVLAGFQYDLVGTP